MRATRARCVVAALLAALAGGAGGCARNTRPVDPVPGLSAQRAMLSEGYSLLYTDASHIDQVELVLLAKIESRAFHDVLKAVSGYGGELKHDLERIARDYPGVRIDLDPLPEMERRKRFAIARDRMLRFAPLSGRSRQEYERTVLIGLSNGLNHESHLCRVMADEEPDAGLKQFLLASEKRYAALHARVVALLDREHYRHGPNGAP